MQRPRYKGPRRVPSTILSRFSIWLSGAFALLQGLVIAGADPHRFTSPAFAVVSQVAGGMTTWGVVLAMLGAAVILGSWRRAYWLKTAAIGAEALWCLSFGVGALIACVTLPNASPTGPGVYLFAGAFCLVLTLVDERNAP